MQAVEQKILSNLRDVPDFPKPGIVFKDITPLLSNPELLNEIIAESAERIKKLGNVTAIAGIEARGFIFGSLLAAHLSLPFVPLRKPGKLPWKTKKVSYALEYGEATIEIHEDAVSSSDNVVIVDDLLATGGTAGAAATLITELGAKVAAYFFIIELGFLGGAENLPDAEVISLAKIN